MLIEGKKIVATIEARMTSSRLPGKVLLPADGEPMLKHLVDRLRQVKSIHSIVLATTVNKADDCLEDFAKEQAIASFRGSEDDVMARVIDAADSVSADIVVEITGDCPVIDPLLVEQTIQMFLRNQCDFASNSFIRSYPDGMDTQVLSLKTLKHSAALTTDRLDREHVTLHICNHPELFRHVYLIASPDLHWPELGLTLDERKDYELLKKLIEHFGPSNPYFSCRDIIALLRSRPEWVAINREVLRKGAT
ncbi:MAG: glycosyltransferase family protein [Syntrophaceae bacterium]|nr:glycosyltransferase family protein [Syntrophaceae bacterium]